jgi:hypothetical protein
MSADAEPHANVRRRFQDRPSGLGLVGRRYERLCAAIVDDVVDLFRRQPRTDRRVTQPCIVTTPGNRQELGPVLHTKSNMVTSFETCSSEQLRQSIGHVIELGIGQDLTRRCHNHRSAVWLPRGDRSRVMDSFGCLGVFCGIRHVEKRSRPWGETLVTDSLLLETCPCPSRSLHFLP